MPGPYKGFLTQCTTKQEHTKPRHQPSDRDQRARERLRNKASAFEAKIKSPAYIALGAAALHTVYQTFNPDFPVLFHLSTLATETAANTILMLYVIQKDRHCMPTSDYYFTNIQQDPIIVPPHRGNNSSSIPEQTAAKDPIPQQTDTLKPGETRVYSESSDEELDQHLHTSQEERFYNTIKGSAQATQAALSYTMAQCNPTVERGPDRKLKIKPLPKEKAEDKTTQTQEKDKSK